MKDKKEKRKHHESTIGKIIYGFLLFAPLLAIAITCGYAMFNKNAYKSYSDETIKGTIEVTNMNQISNGIKYQMIYKNTAEYQETMKISYISITKEQLNISQETYNNINFLLLQPNTQLLRFSNQSAPTLWLASLNWNRDIDFTFIMEEENPYGQSNWLRSAYISQTILTSNKVSDVFYYSINKVEQSNLFNWSKNTAIYTVLNNTSNTLGITNTFWPMLMTYWLIISIIYILYDIVLMMLVIFHRKVHCLQDSI